MNLRWYDMVLLGADYAQNFLVQGELETENAGAAPEQSELELVEFSGSLAGADSVLQQLDPVLVVAGGHIVVKLP